MYFIVWQKEHKHFVPFRGFNGLYLFGAGIDLLFNQIGDEMLMGRTNGIGLPEKPQFIEQWNEYFPENIPKWAVYQ